MIAIDLDHLFRMRLVVARVGEMDLARWWDTKGMLAKTGRIAVSRGLPKTHRFAQARAVFAVARARCREVYNPPAAVTLWDLPADIENAFEDRWPTWIEGHAAWTALFEKLEMISTTDLLSAFDALAPLPPSTTDSVKRLRRAADQKAVPLEDAAVVDDAVISRLAAAFSKGEPGRLAVPYTKLRGKE